MPRVIGTLLVSFAVMLVLGPLFIPMLHKLKFGQPIREDGPKTHAVKKGTPTMGGVMMCVAIAVAALLFSVAEGRVGVMLPGLLFSLGFALVGFLDDYLKVVRKNPKGLRGWYKIIFQVGLGAGVAVYCYLHPAIGSAIYIPFTDILWDMGIWYIPFTTFVVVAMVNSANLLDGVDGLLTSSSLVITATFAAIALFAIGVLEESVARNVAVLAAACAGACLGFLRFNTYPARVIMGDTGSFVLGGVITFVALAMRLPLLLPIAGIMMVVSSVSDIIQIGYFKYTKKKRGEGKRVFRMAPLHHHFELGGMPETQIVALYMTITFIACLIALWAVSV